MGQKVQITLVDDTDGTEAAETVTFGLDGAGYEIDLNTGHAGELRAVLGRYIPHARKTRAAGQRAARGSRKPAVDGVDNATVRAWAAGQGIEISERGRIPGTVIARYRAATGK